MLLGLGFLYRRSNHKKLIAEKEQQMQMEQIKFLERQQQVVSLQSMVNGQETERTRIAKDLHDGLGGLFSTVKMYFSTLEHEQQQLKENELFKKSYEMVDTAATEVRRIAHNMMPEVLMKLGLVQALNDLCSSFSASRMLQVSLQVNGMEERLSPSTEIMLYRIVQELLNNIAKHAQATEAIVQFIRDGSRLSVTVEDNGKGFNAAAADGKKQVGLDSVKSRVDYLNGHISIESGSNIGTTVMMDFLLHA
jgi:signal transduction histidine kinase